MPIVLGGEHATAVPELCLEDAPALHACALGEGEETVVELLEACVGRTALADVAGIVFRTPDGPRRTAPRARIRDVDRIPAPRWDLTPIERYLDGGFSFGVDRGRTMPLLATRGCPYRCTFCSSPRMWTTRYTTRAPALVVDEIEDYVHRYRVENIDFYDLTAIVKRDWILEFCRLLDARGLRITWQLPSGTRSEALDEPVLRAMYRSGCRNVSYAPESGSERTLEAIKKKVQARAPRSLDAHRGARRAQRQGEHPDRLSRRAAGRPARDAALHPAHGAHRRARRVGVDLLALPGLGAVRAAARQRPPAAPRRRLLRLAALLLRRLRRRVLRRRARFDAAAALPPRRAAPLLRRQLPHPSGAPAALALQHRDAPLRVAHGDVVRQPGAPAVDGARARREAA